MQRQNQGSLDIYIYIQVYMSKLCPNMYVHHLTQLSISESNPSFHEEKNLANTRIISGMDHYSEVPPSPPPPR
jgi:hypothetical protein